MKNKQRLCAIEKCNWIYFDRFWKTRYLATTSFVWFCGSKDDLISLLSISAATTYEYVLMWTFYAKL